jgi:glycosyltransferase involved in cell wall biosynthesis
MSRTALNILYVITSSGIGGEERHLLQLARHMAACGHQVRVCCLRERGTIGRRLEDEGFPLVCFDEGERPLPHVLLRNTWRLARLIERHKIDLVHSFLVRGNVEVRLARRLFGVQCVIVNSEGAINDQKTTSAIWLDRATAGSCDVVLANADAVARVLRERERVPASKIRVVYQGVDAARFAAGRPRMTPAASGREVVVGYVGRLHPGKGVRYLIEAAALIRPATRAFRVVIVGDGPEASNLRAQVAALGLHDCVRFAGQQTDVTAFMRSFDILAVPSLEEGLPTVAMEGLASGIPLVATVVGGTPEVVEDGHTGLLVPPADASSLARALQRLITDAALRLRLGRHGLRVVENRFQERRMLAETVAVYDDLLEASAGPRNSAA